eukprot:gene8493-8676_t
MRSAPDEGTPFLLESLCTILLFDSLPARGWLMLHRHWNMFDSFCYSSYVAPRLQTWRAGGEEAVALLFAQMGISQQQAKTAYKSMHTQAKQHFKEKLQGALSNTSLVYSELAVDGFVMKVNREETAASDVVHACTALLTEHTVAETRNTAASGFWDGGIMTVDRRLMINPAAHMQELLLNTLAPTNAREFRHPLTLLRLAYFVARKGSGYRACNFPILVVGPEDPQGFCLVIGLRAKELAGKELQHNIFGATFQELLNHPDSATNWDRDHLGPSQDEAAGGPAEVVMGSEDDESDNELQDDDS